VSSTGSIDPKRLVRALSAATFLEWLGASAVLPILPIYLAHQGASDSVIGLAMAAFFAAGVLVQYPVGRLGDRIGQNRVLMVALLCLALGSLGYLLPVGPLAEVGLRFLQGAGAAAAEVAALSLIGRCVPEQHRGGAFGAIFGAQLAAIAIAPLFGSVAGIGYMKPLFLAGAFTAVLACIPVLLIARAVASEPATADAGAKFSTVSCPSAPSIPLPPVRLRSIAALRGAFVVALIAGLTTGVYEACWTLLLQSRGAESWQIGLSWCLFCVPFVAVSVPAGRLADRFDRRYLVVFSLLASIVLLFVYPFIDSLLALITLGATEAVGVAIAYPAAQSMLAQMAPPRQIGETQGAFSTLQTGAIAVAAAVGGALFETARWLPFVIVGASCAGLLIAVPIIWADGPGRIGATTEPTKPSEHPGGLQVG
jgi:MFS family permease